MKGIDKSFGSNQVLKDAGFVLADGEVHALMGENGAGKSTLMKILTGVYTKDAGTIYVDGREVNYKNLQEAEKAGIVFIHQELNVLYDLTVEENLFIGKEIKGKFGFCNQKAMRKKAEEALGRLGVHISPAEVMSNLSVGQQQMIEICKALMVDAKVIIMDEPTAALTQSETLVLFDVIRSLKNRDFHCLYLPQNGRDFRTVRQDQRASGWYLHRHEKHTGNQHERDRENDDRPGNRRTVSGQKL